MIEHAGKKRKMKPGVFYLLPENYPFKSTYFAGGEFFFIHFTISDRSLYRFFGNVNDIIELDSPDLVSAFDHLSQSSWHAALQSLVSCVILQMISPEICHQLAFRQTLIQQFGSLFDLLETQPPANVRIASIAQAVGMSPGALARKFQRCLGINLKDYLHQKTMMEAQRLLATTQRTIAQIADELGFTDRHYFYQYFQKHNNCTPSQFRNLHHMVSQEASD